MPPTPQQLAIVGHDPSKNGRVVAGPGTGKSWVSVALIKRLGNEKPELKVGLLTFTRAATAELVKKVGAAALDGVKPSTVHSFALSVLLRNQAACSLPLPLRLPDSYELGLIHEDLARQLRARGFKKATAPMVRNLEREMSARWESLDPERVTLASMDPALRNAYLGLWQSHRQKIGYSLFAELPNRAAEAIEDYEINLGGLGFLIVDEYQDLNLADIRLLRGLERRGVRLLAIGDDDQSIYSFRMAAPQGIRTFRQDFPPSADYALTVSLRCGSRIIEAATSVIQQAIDRPARDSLVPQEGAPPGRCEYMRFKDEAAEIDGVAAIVAQRVRDGVMASDIAVLVRSRVRTWAKELVPALRMVGIEAVDTDWVKDAMFDEELRRGLARVRLALDQTDSLAWWTLFESSPGISRAFIDYLRDSTAAGERFGPAIIRLAPEFPGAPKGKSKGVAAKVVAQVLSEASQINFDDVLLGEAGWGGWLLERLDQSKLGEDAYRLLEEVGRESPVEDGLGTFLANLEPVAKDLSLRSNGVRIMSMQSSKGLTVNTCVVMGIEKGLIPFPKGDLEEERRLLYVAMTRATDMCIMTFAHRRVGPTARSGTPNVYQARGRCPFFETLALGSYSGGTAFVQKLQQAGEFDRAVQVEIEKVAETPETA